MCMVKDRSVPYHRMVKGRISFNTEGGPYAQRSYRVGMRRASARKCSAT